MEEEDAILGLAPATASGVEGMEPSGAETAAEETTEEGLQSGWEAFEEAMKAAQLEMDEQAEADEGASSGDDGDGSDKGDDTLAGGAANGALSDEQLLAIEKKKEAKKLGKHEYKRWKKLQKKHGGASGSGGKSKGKKEKKEKKKADKPAKAKKESKKQKSSEGKRGREADVENGFGSDGDDVFAMDEADFLAATQAAATRGRRLESGVLRVPKQGSRKGLTAEQRFAQAEKTASELIEEMRNAQAKDELVLESGAASKAPPLNRVAIKDKVQAMCTRRALIGPLVDAGLLGELSNWLYDLKRGEPGPYELRTTALDILLSIPIESEVDHEKDSKRGEDLTKFSGLSREELQPTNLGRAVNALRLHQQETSSNRSKCVRLLERLSQAYLGRSTAKGSSTSAAAGAPGVVSWKCKNDPTVRSPFDVVQTGSQSFQQAFMKPDPLDPTSYNNLLPWRPPVRSITNLSGTLGQKRD